MTPALSSETYRAPSGPKVRSAGLPIVCAPFKNPDMKSSSPEILSPLTFNLTTLYPTGLELFHEPWRATNKSPCKPSGNCFELIKVSPRGAQWAQRLNAGDCVSLQASWSAPESNFISTV